RARTRSPGRPTSRRDGGRSSSIGLKAKLSGVWPARRHPKFDVGDGPVLVAGRERESLPPVAVDVDVLSDEIAAGQDFHVDWRAALFAFDPLSQRAVPANHRSERDGRVVDPHGALERQVSPEAAAHYCA